MADLVYTGAPAGGPINSSAMPSNFDMVIYKGDAVEFFVNVKNNSGTAVNLTGKTVKAQLRPTYNGPVVAEFTCTLADPVNGRIRVYLPTTVTSSLLPASYIWDLQSTDATGDNRTYLTGDVVVTNEVTV